MATITTGREPRLHQRLRDADPRQLEDPAPFRFLFGHTSIAWVWLLLRVWLGWQWLNSGWGKVTNPKWVLTGESLKAFWERAILIPEPPARPAIAYGWYRDFLAYMVQGEHYTWFGKLVAYGEVLIGVALILGAFTGIAAFLAGFMNWNFMMAGTLSANPLFFAIATWLVLAWKTAGWWGLDRVLLPALGTPWQRGVLFPRRQRFVDRVKPPDHDRPEHVVHAG